MSTMTCPKCDNDLEYSVETVDSGDGAWAQSGHTAFVDFWSCAPDGKKYPEVRLHETTHCLTSCGCVWSQTELEALDAHANDFYADGADEP